MGCIRVDLGEILLLLRRAEVQRQSSGVEDVTELSIRQVIFEVVRQLNSEGVDATRLELSERAGLKVTTIDDRLKVLVDDGLLVRAARGVYKVVPNDPPQRAIKFRHFPSELSGFLHDSIVVEIEGEIGVVVSETERSVLRSCADGSVRLEAGDQLPLVLSRKETKAVALTLWLSVPPLFCP